MGVEGCEGRRGAGGAGGLDAVLRGIGQGDVLGAASGGEGLFGGSFVCVGSVGY